MTALLSIPIQETQPMTAEAYLAQERENLREHTGKHEFFNQKLRLMAGASQAHNIIAGYILTLFNNWIWDSGANAEAYQSDMRVESFLSYKNYLYPDVILTIEEPQFADAHVDILTNPTIIVEVLSDDTESFDRGDKFASYRHIKSLKEYVLVSQYERKIEHFYKNEAGNWQIGNVVKSGEFSFYSIDLNLPIAKIYQKMPF